MDILPTQVYEDDDSFTPTQQLSHFVPHNIKEKHIGSLRIGSITYPIEQGITKIGRHPECDIVLNDQTVSKKHAEIEVNSNETWICDLNSSNKTKLNSSVLRSGRYYELKGGSVVEFGMVRAVYSVLGAMDELLIPETPVISHSRTENMIIPVTPDTSMNFSSTSEDNVSIIPGTQAEKGDSIFRRPSLPVRSSASSRKNYLLDSSSDNSMNDSRGSSALGKENLGEKGVSTHDMETQNSFESQSNLSDDIHDVETQKICLDSFLAAKQSRDQADIHNMETQHEEDVDTQHFVTDIHDVETQHDVDIDDLDTLRKTEVQNALVESDKGASAVEQGQTEEAKLKADVSMEVGKSEIKEEESCSNAVDRPEQAVAAKDENSGNSEQLENGQRGSQDCLELSIATNFDDECSEIDRSSSQNLLENLISDDDPANESGSKSVSPLKSSAINNETTEKSSDEENIFDMATQANANNENVLDGVTKRVDYTFKASLMEDDSDDDTDQEGVFQRYSRIASQDSSQGTVLSKSQPDSEDSDTDEEGRFAAMAMKEKRASVSFEVGQNESKETRNDAGSSRDSDDLFEIATQKVNLENSSKEQGDVSKGSADFDTPTQVIEVSKPEDVASKGSVDFDTPTQVIDTYQPVNVTEKGRVCFDTPTQLMEANEPEDLVQGGDADFDTPTQVIEVTKPEDVASKGSVDFDTPTQVIDTYQPVNVTEKGRVCFDTPTQLIEANKPDDVVEKGSADFDTPTQVIEVSKPEDVASKGSVDFDTPTQVIDTYQPVNLTEKSSVNFDTPTQVMEANEPEDQVEGGSVDFDTPTQVIDTDQPVNVTEKGSVSLDTPAQSIEDTNKNEDDLMPTQILPVGKISRNITAAAKGNTRNEDKAEGETDYNTPTQIIAENVPIYKEPLSNDSERENAQLIEEFTMEDIDYEMAPTQLLSDIEEKKKAALANKKNNSRGKLNRVNLDDTLERNLNEMFGDVNVDIEDDLPQMSTQVLTNMLESPQNKEESTDVNVDKELPGSSKEKTSPRRTRGKSTEAKLEVSPLITTRKSRRSSLKKAVTNDDSQNDSPNLTTKRKRKLLSDSEEIATIGEDKVDTEIEKKSTKKTLNDENNISAELLKSSPKNSPSSRFSRTNKPEELQVPEPVVESVELPRGNKNVAVELDRGDEVSITSVNIGQYGRAITLDSDEDIMAGLPEVQISGTLSNPASPTSSTSTEFRFTTRSMKSKSGTKKTEPKKKILPKKSTRKSVARTNAENNESPKVGRLRSAAFSSSFDNFNVSRVPVTIYETDADIVNEIKPSSSCKSKESGSLQTKPSPLNAEVGKEALVTTVAEPVRKTVVKTSRAVKRSLSSTDVTESNNAKKRKENVTEEASVTTKGRKSTRGVAATRSNSANILDYMSRRDSPVLNSDSSQQSVSSSQESYGSKQLKLMIRRLSSDTPTPLPLIPTRSAKEDVSVNSATSSSSKAENDKSAIVEEKVYPTRGTRSKRAVRKSYVEDDSSEMGEESQEVEMIMNSWVNEENVKQEETNESTKGVRGRGTRARSMNVSFATSTPTKIKHKILFTGITNGYSKLLSKLGSSQVEDPAKCTVLVTDKVRRTVKFLCALAQAVPIVSVSWLVDSEKAGRFTELDNYILKDPAAEAKFGFRLRGSLEKAKKQKLLEGYTIVLTPNVAPPPVQELKSIISSCGGKPLVRPPSSWPQNAVIISREEDMANAKKFLAKASKTVTIQSTEFILTGILRQELDFVKYKLT
ncbi:uncharacterized protein LOC143212609 isoform X2 [Lasioglossum baleicum]|uniref:uncharacterized protein LOC143212609 isoform X2 n=1 Tax=Lasioglossum baleicum TaxID=434251 RepID=UPI003FCE66BD